MRDLTALALRQTLEHWTPHNVRLVVCAMPIFRADNFTPFVKVFQVGNGGIREDGKLSCVAVPHPCYFSI